ncbi:hypothetical protein E0H75_26500 [Kribbella capetownensis]|uniref:RelA/SpoT domain-containing protein n=1 Tax=Kribbella capetownensis TaxID=1572659 RepID=A0A4R0JNW6_9ACTN|nr:hypothetical protein [Kribbella capetownensis]TCC46608.1 hypothetical protein E0H75_26500 [Kribbella capetownensis]
MTISLGELPEPAELHAWLNARRRLDWDERIPTKAQIAGEYGVDATVRSLTLLTEAARVEQEITEDLTASIGPDTSAYQLESRLKSPQSLTRKIFIRTGTDFDQLPLDDVVRYTILAPEPDDLVRTAIDACDSLADRGWEMSGAIHSYADGSRYKGLHLFLYSQAVRVEVQVHSRESIDVKTRTTPLYVVERDHGQPREKRTRARNEAVALSGQMRQPAGIDDLKTLGGVPVVLRFYGRRSNQASGREEGDASSQAQQSAAQRLAKRTSTKERSL